MYQTLLNAEEVPQSNNWRRHCRRYPHIVLGWIFFVVFAIGFALTLVSCEGAPPKVDFFCPMNGNCTAGVVQIAKYQKCDILEQTSWCSVLNCTQESCAKYLFNCELETSTGAECVPFQYESQGFCESRRGSLILFIVCAIFMFFTLIATLTCMSAECLF